MNNLTKILSVENKTKESTIVNVNQRLENSKQLQTRREWCPRKGQRLGKLVVTGLWDYLIRQSAIVLATCQNKFS